MNQQTLARNIQQLIDSSFPDISLVYLFGSRTTDYLGPLSDYDFAVLPERNANVSVLSAQLTHALVMLLDTARVHVITLNQATIELAYAVIAQGRLLFERNAAIRVEYEAQVMSRYGDYLPVLRVQRAELLQGEDDDTRIQWYRTAFERTERTLSKIAATAKQISS